MVFVPWERYGICKFWMLGTSRCYEDKRCRWKHPEPHERERLWREHTDYQGSRWHDDRGHHGRAAAQAEADEDRRDISAHSRPFKQLSSSEPVDDQAVPRTGSSAGIRQDPSQMNRVKSASVEHAIQSSDDVGSASSVPLSPGIKTVDSLTELRPARDYVDMDGSSESMRPSSATAANSEPLGRPNRLLSTAKKEVNVARDDEVHAAAVPKRVVIWRRRDSMTAPPPPLAGEERDHSKLVSAGGYWERRRAQTYGNGNGDGDEYWNAYADVKSDVKRDGEFPEITRVKLPMPPTSPPPPRGFITALESSILSAGQSRTVSKAIMGATKRMSNGEPKPVGPHPSTIKVSQQYISQAKIEKLLSLSNTGDVQEKSQKEARDDSVRLQGVTWLDNTRRALNLPIRTFTTACVYYHKFRLAHPGSDYVWADAAAASLLQSCKVEDTLKKSKDILAAAWNLKAGAHEQLGADDQIFETPSKNVIGLERLVLESGAFDFRSRYPHDVLLKICKSLPEPIEKQRIGKVAWTILTDLHRTFAPLKQTSATLAIACIELSAHLKTAASGSNEVHDVQQALDLNLWSTTRDEIMETLLDALDLYTHHTTSTILGTKYSLDDFLRVRLALNKECNEANIPRHTTRPEPSPDRPTTSGATLRLANGHPTPVSPPPGDVQPSNFSGPAAMPDDGGTLRFILNPQLAADEQAAVQKYFVEEWEEYEEEIEIPIPHARPRDQEREERSEDIRSERGSERGSERRHHGHAPRGHERGGRDHEKRESAHDRRPLRDDSRERDRDRETQRLRERDREIERERARARERDRDRRFEDRRYDERDRYDRRERFDRRYDDDRRRRDDRR